MNYPSIEKFKILKDYRSKSHFNTRLFAWITDYRNT